MTQVRDAPGEGGWRSFAGIAGEGGIDSINPGGLPTSFLPSHPDTASYIQPTQTLPFCHRFQRIVIFQSANFYSEER